MASAARLNDAATPPASAPRQRWLARLSLALLLAAAVVLCVFAGLRGIGLLLLAAGQLVVLVVGVWVLLARRGAVRVAGLAAVAVAEVAAVVVQVRHDLFWVTLLTAALLVLGALSARAALRQSPATGLSERAVGPLQHPFLIMNPRSGGGKVTRFGLKEKAERAGAEVALLDGPDQVDVAALARDAVARGADLLGVAGGDGTQALVAGVAAEFDLPLLVIPAGTRNHFALDLGLDREDPSLALDALGDCVELRVDLGDVGGRPFVNNASFGAYAEIVSRPDYRDDKAGVTLRVLPQLLSEKHGPRLVAHMGTTTVEDPQALLVSNNPYGDGGLTDMERRPHLDGGILGVVAIRVDSAGQAARLIRGAQSPGVQISTAPEVVVDSDGDSIAAGIDGESLRLDTPVRCSIRPGALRVRVPRDRPGVPAPSAGPRFGRLLSAAAPHRGR